MDILSNLSRINYTTKFIRTGDRERGRRGEAEGIKAPAERAG
jgi:hypothetical protein